MPGEATPRLRARGVTVRFGPTTALSAVDLDVTPGEVHAVIGENGAGKSTLMKVLSGAVAPDAGELWLDGEPYAPASPLDAAGRGVAMVYQELSLVPHLGAAENIALGREPLRRGLLNTREMRARARAALAALGHADLDPDLPVRRLPPAVQQIVEIARALRLAGTRVLVLDEPTSSLAAETWSGCSRRSGGCATAASRSSTSRTCSRRCGASPTVSRSFATAGRSAPGGCRTCPCPRSSR